MLTAGQDAQAAVRGYLSASQALLADPNGSFDPLRAVAVGSALGAAEAQTYEYQDMDARIKGGSRIDWLTVTATDAAATPPSVTVTACLDDSGVTVFTPEHPRGITSTLRNQMIFTVFYDGGVWKVSDLTFADQPSC